MAETGRVPPSPDNRDSGAVRADEPVVQGTSAESGHDPGPEGNATLREVWSRPDGEAMSYRGSLAGSGSKTEDHSELTAAETPEATRRLGDATLKPEDRDATAEAIARATAVTGREETP